jgi:hypothetical protein
VKKTPYLERCVCVCVCVCVFSIFSCCTKSGDRPQVDLVKCDYKTNRHVENLDFRLHVGKPVEHMSLIWRFQNQKAKNLLNFSQKMLVNPFNFSSKCGDFIGIFFKSFLDHLARRFLFFFLPKMANFCHQKNH